MIRPERADLVHLHAAIGQAVNVASRSRERLRQTAAILVLWIGGMTLSALFRAKSFGWSKPSEALFGFCVALVPVLVVLLVAGLRRVVRSED